MMHNNFPRDDAAVSEVLQGHPELNSVASLRWQTALHERDLRPEGKGFTGFECGGWQDSTWILHQLDAYPTSADRTAIESAMATTVTSRIWWNELIARHAIDVRSQQMPPYLGWFHNATLPEEVVAASPPGALDNASLARLIALLLAATGSGPAGCIGYWSPLAVDLATPLYFEFDLRADNAFGDRQTFSPTPSNWWPHDLSWMVYSDGDLCATQVSGSSTLIASIRADGELETLNWPA